MSISGNPTPGTQRDLPTVRALALVIFLVHGSIAGISFIKFCLRHILGVSAPHAEIL